MQNVGLYEAQAGIKIAGRNVNKLRCAVAESEALKSLLKVKEESEKVGLNIRNELPVQVRCRIQDARGWCTGMTQRDDMVREVGGGFRIGKTCTAMADSC